ncbi:hypothetical protein MNBD_BACTEROID03-1699 [hydrothermal vent metagenome]|uniref:HTH HARE-type domain-containing protein n=1 Tax=hydrothermal vent metagenome TaxID=652676 RepID=A0A3B0T167_9ZZZZ
MTLHEAIEKVLQKKGGQMTTAEIANELNINKWCQKKDGSEIIPFQIHGRTRNYPNLFDRNGSTVLWAVAPMACPLSLYSFPLATSCFPY